MRTWSGIVVLVLLVAATWPGCIDSESELRGAAGTDTGETSTLRVAAAPVPSTSDTLRPLTAVLSELAVVWYSLTDAELRFGCRDRGLARLDWAPPTEGSPVQRYVVDLWIRGTVWGDTTCIVPIPVWADSGRARTAGVDSLGWQGPWSDLLDWHVITED